MLQCSVLLLASYLAHGAIQSVSSVGGQDAAPSELFVRIYRAFDSGLVKKWGKVSDFDREFSTDLSKRCARSHGDGGEWVTFDLEAQDHSRSDDEAASAHGWYVAFNCDKNGVILDYYLSNSRK